MRVYQDASGIAVALAVILNDFSRLAEVFRWLLDLAVPPPECEHCTMVGYEVVLANLQAKTKM